MDKKNLYDEEIKSIADEILNVKHILVKDSIIRHINYFKRDEFITFISGAYSDIFKMVMKYGDKKFVLIKFASSNEDIRKTFSIRARIENEVYFYSKLYPSILDFVAEIDNSGIRKSFVVGEYYVHSLDTEGGIHERLAIRDIVRADMFYEPNYKMGLNASQIELVFLLYGHFNAKAYLLKEKNIEKFNELVSPLQNIIKTIIESDRFTQNFETVCFAIKKFLKPEKDYTLFSYFKKYLNNGKQILVECTEKTGKYDTIIHGNLWSSHMLFKDHPKSGRKPAFLRIIDWKCVKLGNPVYDLSYCLYSDAPKWLLDNLNECLKIYYNSLISSLKEFKCDISRIFTYNELLEEWKAHSEFGFLMAIQVIFMKCVYLNNQPTDLSTIPETKLFKTLRYDEKKFETLIRDLLNHMLELENLSPPKNVLDTFDVI